MRIGILPALDKTGGGIYQYSQTMLGTLRELQQTSPADELVVFTRNPESVEAESLERSGWVIKPLFPSTTKWRFLRVLRPVVGENPYIKTWRLRQALFGTPDLDKVHIHQDMNRWLHKSGIQLMIYPFPDSLALETDVPYLMAIHDLQHRLQPHFPEVSGSGGGKWREYLFRNAVRRATLLLVDSEVGKEDVLNIYGIYGVTAEKVRILPFLPAYTCHETVTLEERQKVRQHYILPEKYLFYPAQFWPHKNHLRIAQAIGKIKYEYGSEIHLVLSGANSGKLRQATFLEVAAQARQMRIENQVHYLGYVPYQDMGALYSEALAMIMPTFFGPTNIPILEAWAFDCPVITSDIRGVREQAGDAAILVDPQSVDSIASGIREISTNDQVRQMLIANGRRRLSTYSEDDYRQTLNGILEDARLRIAIIDSGQV